MASCGCLYHQKCLEGYFLNIVKTRAKLKCPNWDCKGGEIKTLITQDLFKETGKPTSSTVDVTKPVDSGNQTPMNDDNLEEANDNGVSIFLQLSDKIDNAETKNEDASRGLIYSYFDFGKAVFKQYKELKVKTCSCLHDKDEVRALVNSEVREEIPETKCSNDALWKRMERSWKMHRIFNTIGKEKMAQITSISCHLS
ncbi:hypothetical protein RhiirA4_508729 [Rhizophagus irregularis]|uniref:RING-type domain-containing protein n=1 Tax=Rhizophagus irregularis TaxID=588596 RepID=A0A2I1HDM7_9GLOM|nr:hypothetical protein RhiirA4_508729 [Rhizophagus irregularis]